MPNMDDGIVLARRVLPIIYVLDSSGSMSGERIASVNEAMHETTEVLKDLNKKNPDAEVKVGVLKFATGAEWVTNGLEDLEDFFWNDIQAGGLTDLGSALKELESKLSRSEFLTRSNSEIGFCIPVIMFLSDGQPTDNFEKALESAKNNKWFRHATKIAIAVGDDADKEMLAKVVGNSEAVVGVNDVNTLKMLIKVASMTSSMIGSVSKPNNANNNDAIEIIHIAEKELGKEADKLDINIDDDSWMDTEPSTDNNDSFDTWDDDGDWD